MKYTLETVGIPESFEQFCERFNLSVIVRERKHWGGDYLAQSRYWASYDPLVEEPRNGLLYGPVGNGDTPEAAILALANDTLSKHLVIGAYTKERFEFDSPTEWTT